SRCAAQCREPRACPTWNCSSTTTDPGYPASARAVATPVMPAPTTTMSASRRTAWILGGSGYDSALGRVRRRPRQRAVGLGELVAVAGGLGRFDRVDRVRHGGVDAVPSVCEHRLADADPARELPHHLE